MKIYNVVKIPKGLGYDVDYDAIYQSGYTAGYHTGYDNGSELCSKFVLTPDELEYPISGGGNDVQITTSYPWVIDDDFEWEYETTDSDVSWTGFSAESLNRIEVSENAGEGDKEITITAPDLTDAPRVFIGSTAVYTGAGFTAMVISRSGNLKTTAKTEYGDYSKYVDVEQNMAQRLVFGPSGGSIPIILDTDGSDLDWYSVGLARLWKPGAGNPWSAYTLNYSGLVTDLPRTLTLTVPPYTDGLDDYYYGEDGEINTYYWFQFLNGVQTDTFRFYITIQKPEVPRLYITHNFPTEEGQYREVPSTGATYTMTISGNSNWTANTVNFDGPDALCILSQSSGAANELTTVTVTFPESSTLKRGLIEIGTVDAPVAYYAFQFKQEAARKAPVTLTITSPGEIVFGRGHGASRIPYFELEVYLNGVPTEWWDSQHENRLTVSEGDTVQLIVDRFQDPRSGWMSTSIEIPAFFSATTCEFELSGNLLSLLGGEYENYDTIQEVWNAEYSASVPRYVLGGVFYGCTGLTDASKLIMPTDLTERSFAHMFEGCTSLTKAPVLPVSALTSMCYRHMFYDCSSLNVVKCLATDMSASMCTDSWMSGVASTGTFYKATGSTWSSGDSGIPNNWTIIEEE